MKIVDNYTQETLVVSTPVTDVPVGTILRGRVNSGNLVPLLRTRDGLVSLSDSNKTWRCGWDGIYLTDYQPLDATLTIHGPAKTA